MPLQKPIPLPDPIPENKVEDRRLWVGNLDPRKFDLLFHRTGPLAGQPRGYAFVTYSCKENAVKAKDALDKKMVGNKRVVVRWANNVSKDELDKPRPEIAIPALAGAKSERKISRETTIQAIEAKLKMMEHNSVDDFEVNNAPTGSLHPQRHIPATQQPSLRHRQHSRHDSRPYRRSNYRR
ncbi:hypothetical protein L9F63_022285, partial [Diploptera punctata]